MIFKFGFIDQTGNETVACEYDSADDFHAGLALVNKDGKCGFIDESGKEAIPFIYDSAKVFNENGLSMVEKDGKWGVLRINNFQSITAEDIQK